MNFKILNRGQVLVYVPTGREILISITDVDDKHFKKCHPAPVSDKFIDVLRLRFDDVDRPDTHVAVPITDTQAQEILKFVSKHRDTINILDRIVVNCEGGLSRSAGTVAALSRIIDHDDDWVFRSKPFLNRLVYRTILQQSDKNKKSTSIIWDT